MVKNSESFKRAILNQLRKRIPDPVTSRDNANSQSFSGNGSTTTFTLTFASSPCLWIESVTVDGSTKRPHTDYDIHFGDSSTKPSVIFHTAPASGTNNVVIAFYEGENWIYPDQPQADAKYPRISLQFLGGESEEISGAGGGVFRRPEIRLGIHVKKDYTTTYTLNSVTYGGGRLADYLQDKVREACASIRSNNDIVELLNILPSEFDEPDTEESHKIKSSYCTLRLFYTYTYS